MKGCKIWTFLRCFWLIDWLIDLCFTSYRQYSRSFDGLAPPIHLPSSWRIHRCREFGFMKLFLLYVGLPYTGSRIRLINRLILILQSFIAILWRLYLSVIFSNGWKATDIQSIMIVRHSLLNSTLILHTCRLYMYKKTQNFEFTEWV